jgi:hypothetical protein
MSRRHKQKPHPLPQQVESKNSTSTRLKVVLSLFLVWHLWSVLAEPLRFQTRGPTGPSPIAETLYAPVRPYSEFLFLTHGYAFFAPDPGPSHLIDVTVRRGEEIVSQRRYPDRQLDWPRLYYHRHFMLTEFLHNLARPPLPDQARLTEQERATVAAEERLYLVVRESFRRHLAGGSDAVKVEMERIEHRMPFLDEHFQQQMTLTDSRLYTPIPEPDGDPPVEPSAEASGFQEPNPHRVPIMIPEGEP